MTDIAADRLCPVQKGQSLLFNSPSGDQFRANVSAIEYVLKSATDRDEVYGLVLDHTELRSEQIPCGTQAFAIDDSWRSTEITKPIKWAGDLSDDCTAMWAGLTLRAEEMDEGFWWWCVYDDQRDNLQIDSSNESDDICKSGLEARELAEAAARDYLKPLG